MFKSLLRSRFYNGNEDVNFHEHLPLTIFREYLRELQKMELLYNYEKKKDLEFIKKKISRTLRCVISREISISVFLRSEERMLMYLRVRLLVKLYLRTFYKKMALILC